MWRQIIRDWNFNVGKCVWISGPFRSGKDNVAKKRHVGRTPTQLWLSRPEYQVVARDKFSERIRQEIRYQKFVYLNEKRLEKEERVKARRQNEAQREEYRKKQQAVVEKKSKSKNGSSR